MIFVDLECVCIAVRPCLTMRVALLVSHYESLLHMHFLALTCASAVPVRQGDPDHRATNSGYRSHDRAITNSAARELRRNQTAERTHLNTDEKGTAMKTLTTEQLKDMQDRGDNFTLINTLDAKSFAQTRLPNAINIAQTSTDFVDRVFRASGGKDKKVVVYCAHRECDSSTQAAQKLENAGFTQVFDYEGGAKEWQEQVHTSAPTA